MKLDNYVIFDLDVIIFILIANIPKQNHHSYLVCLIKYLTIKLGFWMAKDWSYIRSM